LRGTWNITLGEQPCISLSLLPLFAFGFSHPPNVQFTTIPLVFALGALALLIKGIFLMRKSSEGLGLSDQELADLSNPANRKRLPCFGVADNPGIDGDAPFTRAYAGAPLQTLDQRDSGR